MACSQGNERTFQYMAENKEMKAIFRYLDHQQEHKNELSRKVAHLGIVKIIPQNEKEWIIEIEKRSKMELSRWENTCKSCVEKFLNTYTSWSKHLDVISDPGIQKNLKGLHEKYKEDCFVNWFKSTSTILATGKKEKVEKVMSDVENILLSHSPQRDSQVGNAQTFMYNYQKPAILRFVQHNKHHQSDLRSDLQEIAESKFIQTEKIIQVEVTPTMNSMHLSPEKFKTVCCDKLEIFFSKFDTVKCVYPITYIESKSPGLLQDIKEPDLFVQWIAKRGTVYITGLRENVETHKLHIEKTIGMAQNVNQTPPPSPRKDSQVGNAQTFMYNYQKPAILRFVQHNKHHQSDLRSDLQEIAESKFIQTEKIIQVEVTPTMNSMHLSPEKFKTVCCDKLEIFFSKFDTVKCVYPITHIQSTSPGLLQDIKQPDLFVQWIAKRGTVYITGLRENVETHKLHIEKTIGIAQNVNQTPPPSRRKDSQVGNAQTFMYNYQKPAILRFVQHNKHHQSDLRSDLQEIAESKFIQTEKIIQVEVTPTMNSMHLSPEKFKTVCCDKLEIFFSKFDTVKCVYPITHIQSTSPGLLQDIKQPDLFVQWIAKRGTVYITGLRENVETHKLHIEKTIGIAQNVNQTPPPSRRKDSQVGNAQTFMYNYQKPAILRFVQHNKHHQSDLRSDLQEIAESKFIQTEKIIQVEVTPTMNSMHLSPEKFKTVCCDKLEIFFSKFDTVKCVYPITHIQSTSPGLLQDIKQPDLFVQWIAKRGTVYITGLRENVETHKLHIEKTIGIAQNVNQTPPPSRRKQSVYFKSESVPPAVLKFIRKNEDCKAKLKVCCGNCAETNIVNEEGSIKIKINFNENGTGLDTEKKCKESVQKYLENFSSENPNFDTERLARARNRNADIFTNTSGHVFIQPFEKVVKVTGFKDEVAKKVAEIRQEVECDVEEEILPVHVFIVQRECEVWKKVMDYVPTVTITPIEEKHIIEYKGTPDDINRAKQKLGLISESLHEGPVLDSILKTRQKNYLEYFMESQEKAKTRAENKLEWLYALLREQSLHGALAIKDGVIHLLCESKQKWTRCIEVLQQNILENKIPVSGITTKIMDRIRSKSAEISVLAQKSGSDHILVIGNCKSNDQLQKIIDAAVEEQDMEKREYKMPRQKAEHIIRFCKIDQAQKMELFPKLSHFNQQSVQGLMITCAKEDIDEVDLWLEDLQIESATKKFSGYSIHEYLSGNGKNFLAVVENETKSSFFFHPVGETLLRAQRTTPVVDVVFGNILEEKCDAIVISTGSDISVSGQVGQSLLEKYGDRVFAHFDQNSRWEIPNKLYVVSGCQRILPWKYVFKYVISSQNLKKDLIDLFLIADKLKIKSLTLPTIGAGDLGLTGDIVASNMQEALEEFKKQNPTHLRSIKVVVFDKSLLHYFNPLASGTESAHFTRNRTKSHGTSATVYSNNKECLKQALKKLQETIDQHFKEVQLNNKPMEQFSNGIKEKIEKSCHDMDVFLTWEFIGSCEHCKLQGIVDNVRKAEDEVKKILHNDSNLPFEWTSMPDGERYHKEILQRNSTEYKKVKARFTESNPSFSKIIKIARIQNPFQYKQFRARSDYVRNLPGNATKDIVKQLFHGTNRDRVEKICRDGFDRGFAGENGTLYGRGVYFAVNSSYSTPYASISSRTHHRYMFSADVVTGEYQLGRPEYRAAPNNPVRDIPYDSLVDNVANPEIFVVFPDASVYPSYLITFV